MYIPEIYTAQWNIDIGIWEPFSDATQLWKKQVKKEQGDIRLLTLDERDPLNITHGLFLPRGSDWDQLFFDSDISKALVESNNISHTDSSGKQRKNFQ